VRLEDVYDQDAEQALLAALLDPRYARMLVAVHELVASALPEATDFRLDDAAARMILEEAATRVVLIDQATQAAIRAVLTVGQARGYSAHQVAYGVPEEDFPGIDGLFSTTWKGRAETVARTELATAQLTAARDRYRATGLVSRVQIVENEDTDEPCASMNGKVFPVDDAPGLEHPNCRRAYLPLLDEAAA